MKYPVLSFATCGALLLPAAFLLLRRRFEWPFRATNDRDSAPDSHDKSHSDGDINRDDEPHGDSNRDSRADNHCYRDSRADNHCYRDSRANGHSLLECLTRGLFGHERHGHKSGVCDGPNLAFSGGFGLSHSQPQHLLRNPFHHPIQIFGHSSGR